MTREDLQQQGNAILDEMYKAKTQDEWETEMRKLIPLKVEAQKNGWTDWLEAVQKRVDKQRQFKQPYWEKMKNKNQFQPKPKMMFSEETDRAIENFFRIVSEYLKLKMN